jgi:hypothetical protein
MNVDEVLAQVHADRMGVERTAPTDVRPPNSADLRRLAALPDDELATFERSDDEPSVVAARLRAQVEDVLRSPEAAIGKQWLSRDLAEKDVDRSVLLRGFPAWRPELAKVQVRVNDRMFEPVADALAWMVTCTAQHLEWGRRDVVRQPKRLPGKADGFRYTIPAPGVVRVAVLSDFATGRYYARWIADQVRRLMPDLCLHLGDVYYAGTRTQVRKYLREPLDPVLRVSPFFNLAGNHDMYSEEGAPFYEQLDWARRHRGQLQEGAWWSVTAGRFQLIGVDTESTGAARVHSAVRSWLARELDAARAAGRRVLLFTSDEPYGSDGPKSGKNGLTTLWREDLADVLGGDGVDLWMWGNWHYAAAYAPTPSTPFLGVCTGHAGFPEARAPWDRAHPTLWHETGPRFAGALADLRADRLRNGYSWLDLHPDGTIELTFVDWLGHERCRLRVPPGARTPDLVAVPEGDKPFGLLRRA